MTFDLFDLSLYTDVVKEGRDSQFERLSQFAGQLQVNQVTPRVNALYEAMKYCIQGLESLKANPNDPEKLRQLENQIRYISSMVTEFKTDLT